MQSRTHSKSQSAFLHRKKKRSFPTTRRWYLSHNADSRMTCGIIVRPALNTIWLRAYKEGTKQEIDIYNKRVLGNVTKTGPCNW